MSRFLKRRSKKSGLPPGSLVHIGDIRPEHIKISIMDFDENNFIEKKEASLKECLSYLDKPTLTWIQVSGIYDPKTIETIGQHFHLHPLIMEDILNTGQRAKLDDYKEVIFIVMRMLQYNGIHSNLDHKDIVDEQVSLILGRNYVISFMEHEDVIFNPIRDRIRIGNTRIRKSGPDYLIYSLMDAIVDGYFGVLEKVDDNLDLLENELIENPASETLQKIQTAKREMALLRKSIWPTRELISQFLRLESPLIQQTTIYYVHDIYDHTIQAIDTVEGFRDLVSGMLDIYLSNINQRLNEVMKVLTVVATIFVPLTFITSLYGMNFEYMPELQIWWGYPAVLGFMLLCSFGMLCFFRKKGWI